MKKPVNIRFLILCVATMSWSATSFMVHQRPMPLRCRTNDKVAIVPQVISASVRSEIPFANQTQSSPLVMVLKNRIISKTFTAMKVSKNRMKKLFSRSKNNSINALNTLNLPKIGYRFSTTTKNTCDCGKSMGLKTLDFLRDVPNRVGTTTKQCNKLAAVSLRKTLSFTNRTIITSRRFTSNGFKSGKITASKVLQSTKSLSNDVLHQSKIVTPKSIRKGITSVATSAAALKTTALNGHLVTKLRTKIGNVISFSSSKLTFKNPRRDSDLSSFSDVSLASAYDVFIKSDKTMDSVFHQAASDVLVELAQAEVEKSQINLPIVFNEVTGSIGSSLDENDNTIYNVLKTELTKAEIGINFEVAPTVSELIDDSTKTTHDQLNDNLQLAIAVTESDLGMIGADIANDVVATGKIDVNNVDHLPQVIPASSSEISPNIAFNAISLTNIVEEFNDDKTSPMLNLDTDEDENKLSLSYTTSRIKNFFWKVKNSSDELKMSSSLSAKSPVTIASPITKAVKNSVPVFFRSPTSELSKMLYRQQPRSTADEKRLQAKYAAIPSLEERAFQILVDLRMVDVHSELDGAGEWE